MRLFSKKYRDIKELNKVEPKWSLNEGSWDNAPIILRINESAREWAGQPKLSIKLAFAVPLNKPNANGLPDPEENREIDKIEDIIEQDVREATTGMLVMILTTGQMKEFVFYIVPGADIASIHKNVQKQVTTHKVQCIADHEPEWDSYKEIIAGRQKG